MKCPVYFTKNWTNIEKNIANEVVVLVTHV